MNVVDFFRFLFKMTISKSQLLRDIDSLRNDISDLKKLLVPFTDDELEILSLNQSNITKKKRFSPITRGIFNTIYYEPLIAYGIKNYSNKQKLMLICTSMDEFVYLTKGNKTHVFMNDSEAGVLTSEGKFYSIKNKLLALIDGNDNLQSHTVWIQGKDVGYINNPRFVSKSIPRAYHLLKPMSKEEQNIFLCLTLVNLVEEGQLHKI
jgi:hypothetical protein